MASLAGLSFGRYRVRARWGQGGMGEVYLGSAVGPDGVEKPVAIKTIRALHRQRRELVEMFLEEAKVSFLLTHPNIVQTYELGALDDHHFLVMEWVEGITLEALLEFFRDTRRQPLPVALALSLAMQVARALDYAHTFADTQGRPLRIVHRDVSPSNVLLSRDGQIKVTDFGLVKSVLSKVETEVGQIKGKAAYMAPEQLASRPADARTDIYSLGLMLYEMLSGEHPFGARGEVTLMARLSGVEIPPLAERAPDLAPAVIELVASCVATDPAARFSSAGELGRRIDRCMREAGLRVSEYELAELVTQVSAAAEPRLVAPHPFDLALGVELQRVAGGTGGLAAFKRSGVGTVVEGGPRGPAAPPASTYPASPQAPRASAGRGAQGQPAAPAPRHRSRALVAAGGATLLLGLVYLATGRGGSPPTAAPVAGGGAPVAAATQRATPGDAGSARALPQAATTWRGASDAATAARALPDSGPLGRPDAAEASYRRLPSRRGWSARQPEPRSARGGDPPAPPAPVLTGTLSVNSEPWAVVFVDGVRLRSTPLLGHPLAVGLHVVRLEHPPRQLSATRSVVIRAGEETRLAVELGP
jgi:tRNA A-37 threonylcarbamoyl transferase component Bud32